MLFRSGLGNPTQSLGSWTFVLLTIPQLLNGLVYMGEESSCFLFQMVLSWEWDVGQRDVGNRIRSGERGAPLPAQLCLTKIPGHEQGVVLQEKGV